MPQGVKNATTDQKQVMDWWRRYPSFNIGVTTGTIIVLDVDPRHRGFESLAALETEHDILPTTWTVRTGSDGRHYYFAAPPGVTIRNSAGRLGPGLDVRGAGGYIVAPISMHITGNCYAWIDDPDAVPLAPLPQWLAIALVPPPPKAITPAPHGRHDSAVAVAKVRGLVAVVARSPEGQRNQITFWAACRIREMLCARELDRAEGAQAIAALAEAGRRIGLSLVEISRTVASAMEPRP